MKGYLDEWGVSLKRVRSPELQHTIACGWIVEELYRRGTLWPSAVGVGVGVCVGVLVPSLTFISVATLAATDIAATLRGWVHPILPVWQQCRELVVKKCTWSECSCVVVMSDMVLFLKNHAINNSNENNLLLRENWLQQMKLQKSTRS